MGLYIKGEKLPKYGYNELRVCPNGTLEFRDKTDVLVRIPNAVIEVKEPHGDLVDAEVVKHAIIDYHDKEERIRVMINAILAGVPTVIEAEE